MLYGTTNGRRLALCQEGFCSPLVYMQGGDIMNMQDILSLVKFLLKVIDFVLYIITLQKK